MTARQAAPPPLLVSVDVVDRFLNGSDLFSFFVRNFSVEFLFQSHYQLNGVEGISTQVFSERRVVLNFFRFNAQLFNNDFLDALFNAAHEGKLLKKSDSSVQD
ncbi:phox homology (PX) domain protein [Zymobacter palmae]|uniref:Phox homology (PX) domain protein n=1 Tax=Zymobacter palmae TaxID=33074 RepID=A0A348HGH3_9GAMM|nr:phox homology (PX) domain protein [Zymobacter palmae]